MTVLAQRASGPRRCPAAVVALLLALAPLGAGVAVARPAPDLTATPPPIVARAIAHHGGELYRHSETALELCSGSGCYRIRARVDGGLYQHEVSGPYRDRVRTVRADNERVSAWRDGEPLAVLPEARQALRDWAMARVYFAFLPYRLVDPGVLHEDLGIERWGDRSLHKVKVTFVAGSSTDADDEYLYWFDPTSARLEQFAYSYRGRPGGLRFRRLGNYRRVGGILFFDQSNLGVEGDGLDVGQITPEFVRQRMRTISEVTLRAITVQPLP